MFNLFKKKSPEIQNIQLFNNWYIDLSSDFKLIDNKFSIQFVNKDETKLVFASLLTNEKEVLNSDEKGAMDKFFDITISKRDNYYDLKAIKNFNNEILTVLITYKNVIDENWARKIFESIKYKI